MRRMAWNKNWLAEDKNGRLARLNSSSSRDHIVDHLVTLVMYDHVDQFLGMEWDPDPVTEVEGAIWSPSNPQLIDRPVS